MEKERLIWFDALKGWLILFVVMGHAIQYCLPEGNCENNYLWNLIYSFHMPTFMAASGYVNYRPFHIGKKFVKRRIHQLLVPFLLWSLIKWMLGKSHSFNDLVHTMFSSGGFFWFLWVLWAITMIFIIGEKLSLKLKTKQEFIIGLPTFMLVGIKIIHNFRMFGY